MSELVTPALPARTQLWHPSAPDVDELRTTLRRTQPDDSLDADLLPRGRVLPGTRLQIEAWLGEGTTAIVYRGHHIDLRRPLAIKVLKDLDPDETVRERFLAEARLTSDLDSEYVVNVLDFGRLEDGRLYYAMAYLDGQPLDELLEEGPLPLPRAIPLLRMACKGLQQAHDKGIVHRDIKPENMMVVHRRGHEHLVLVDFGIATSSGSSTGRVCGTPYTMAPEQIEGRPVDARTDVYALGCCAFQMLTGRPFAAGATLTATLECHLSIDRARIDPASGVPAAIAAVIHRCLALDPADRYPSARELEAALCEAQIATGLVRIGGELPPPDVDDDRRERISAALARPRRRIRVLGAGTAGIAAGVLLSLGGSALALERETPAPVFDTVGPTLATVTERLHDPADQERASARLSFAELTVAPALEEAPAPHRRIVPARRKASRPAPPAVAKTLAAMTPPVAHSRSSLLGFRDERAEPWTARSRARELVRDGDKALRHGDRRRAHELYRRAASLGSRRGHARLEELERG